LLKAILLNEDKLDSFNKSNRLFYTHKTFKFSGAMSAGGSPGSPSQCSGLGGLIGGHNSDLNNQGSWLNFRQFIEVAKRPK